MTVAEHDTLGRVIGLSETQLAAVLGVSAKAIQRARSSGTLPPQVRTVKIGQQRRYLVVLDASAEDAVTATSIPAALAVARRTAEASIPAKEGER